MDLSLALIDLAGFVALLLWGVHMVQTGVQRAFGPRLRLVLGSALRTRLAGFAAGLGVTAILQSSTATALMVSGFAAAGLVSLVSGLGVMLGANVGTTLIVQILSLHVSAAAPALILIGVVAFRRSQESRWRDLGRTAIGLGLVLLALREMLLLLEPMEQGEGLRLIAGLLANQPILALLLGALLAWAAHSSATAVLFVMSLATTGMMPLHAAFAMTLGANLGTAINPCLEAGAGDDPAARRVPLGNLGFRVLGCAAVLPALDPIGRFLVVLEPDPARSVADFHTLFNLASALVFLPLLAPYAAALRRLLPDRAPQVDPTRPA
ncbi:MAG: Na/Pi symporter, partial [Acetobacteraceae bacterium]